MKFLKTLDNPFLLGLQGFVAGALLVWSSAPDSASASPKGEAEAQIAALQGISR